MIFIDNENVTFLYIGGELTKESKQNSYNATDKPSCLCTQGSWYSYFCIRLTISLLLIVLTPPRSQCTVCTHAWPDSVSYGS